MTASAHIQWFDRNRDGFVEYSIKVYYSGRQWMIKKRYKEFSILNDYLEKYDMEIPYPLPPKYPWRKHDEKMLKKRRGELQNYLDGLLNFHPINSNRFLKEFLEIDMGLLALTRKKSKKDVLSFEQLKFIPDFFSKSIIPFANHIINPIICPPSPTKSTVHLPLRKSKSLSFSNRTLSKLNNSGIQRESFADFSAHSFSSSKDRKFSVDYFISGGLSTAEGKGNQRKKIFIAATNNVWTFYMRDVESCCIEVDTRHDQLERVRTVVHPMWDTKPLWASISKTIEPFVQDPSSKLHSFNDIIKTFSTKNVTVDKSNTSDNGSNS
jgi:hypothetical protein